MVRSRREKGGERREVKRRGEKCEEERRGEVSERETKTNSEQWRTHLNVTVGLSIRVKLEGTSLHAACLFVRRRGGEERRATTRSEAKQKQKMGAGSPPITHTEGKRGWRREI